MMSLPKIEGKPLYIVDRHYEHEEFQDFMHSDLVKQVITSGKFPSVFHDVNYPELLVLWDAGESPHNPDVFDPKLMEGDGWLEHNCYPPELWEWVKAIATNYLGSAANTAYCAFWLRGCDAADRDYPEDGPPYDAAREAE